MRYVQNCSSVGIIHRAKVPAWVFMEVKTPGYPVLSYVGKGLLPGGNWVQSKAKDDASPLGTYQREITEELTFDNPAVDPGEMDVLFGEGHLGHAPVPRNIVATQEDQESLVRIVKAITSAAAPFGAFVQTVEKSVFDMGNPKNTRGQYVGLCHVFTVPLPDETWSSLVDLQARYGNLSNESQSIVMSVWEIVAKNLYIAWGHGPMLQQFFIKHGLEVAKEMPLMPCTQVEEVPFCSSYEEVLKQYEVEKKP